MLMVIEERVIGPACLSAGSLVSKAALGGAEKLNTKSEGAKKRASEQEQTMLSAERRKSNLLDLDIPQESNTRIQHVHHVIAKVKTGNIKFDKSTSIQWKRPALFGTRNRQMTKIRMIRYYLP